MTNNKVNAKLKKEQIANNTKTKWKRHNEQTKQQMKNRTNNNSNKLQ